MPVSMAGLISVACLMVILLGPVTVLSQKLPAFIGTYGFSSACVDKGWNYLNEGRSLLDAVELGISEVCESNRCARSVGAYGKVDEGGEPSLDGMIMEGRTMRAGAVGNLKNVKEVIRVARAVMKHTTSTFLAGAEVTKFATDMGFTTSNLTNNFTDRIYERWLNRSCQPNSRVNVLPDPKSNCGPYRPDPNATVQAEAADLAEDDHDTVCMIGVDGNGDVVVGTSTNGLDFKVPGRVGDTPIVGAGGFADNEAGAAAATGNGDVMMRFLPSYQAVESMRQGMSPSDAAADAMRRILRHEANFSGALIVMSKTGEYGAGCARRRPGWFPFTVRTSEMSETRFERVRCLTPDSIGTTPPSGGARCSSCAFYSVFGSIILMVLGKI